MECDGAPSRRPRTGAAPPAGWANRGLQRRGGAPRGSAARGERGRTPASSISRARRARSSGGRGARRCGTQLGRGGAGAVVDHAVRGSGVAERGRLLLPPTASRMSCAWAASQPSSSEELAASGAERAQLQRRRPPCGRTPRWWRAGRCAAAPVARGSTPGNARTARAQRVEPEVRGGGGGEMARPPPSAPRGRRGEQPRGGWH